MKQTERLVAFYRDEAQVATFVMDQGHQFSQGRDDRGRTSINIWSSRETCLSGVIPNELMGSVSADEAWSEGQRLWPPVDNPKPNKQKA